MSILNKLVIEICYKVVGVDQFGNKYYEGNKVDSLGNKKRYVIYKGSAEPSKIPPLWHAWLHYTVDEIPAASAKSFVWQQNHLPNLTGSKLAYYPLTSGQVRKEVSADYKKWQPK
ncbi:NADH-ubiquinone oxidoreductase subunit NDUFA12 family protein [Candidatus Trichorickettsia mobilis]|uniref:NADH-ubiquinone oxidoreductase subunit NDUFA12 family protein n=1 Tax=Candidatus Trichorickettsia mobilis TaxID=1346319 RepID=UPI00292D99C4|nr:NADH-ubiquinone oxidoreductase subunit NDUFA12 family protein [Candidatus Trichorickettsia mobilis]